MTSETPVNGNYKDTVFRMLFKDRGRLLELYNAVSGRTYDNPEELEIVALEKLYSIMEWHPARNSKS